MVSFLDLIPLRGLAKVLCESYTVLKWVLPWNLSTNSTVKLIKAYHFGVPCVTVKYPFFVNAPRCFLIAWKKIKSSCWLCNINYFSRTRLLEMPQEISSCAWCVHHLLSRAWNPGGMIQFWYLFLVIAVRDTPKYGETLRDT